MKIIELIGDEKYGGIELLDEIPSKIQTNLLGIMNEFWKDLRFFDGDGMSWKAEPRDRSQLEIRFWEKILSWTIYCPRCELELRLIKDRPYEIEEIKKMILGWLPNDDDIWKQFLEVQEIEAVLDHVKDYESLILAIRIIQGQFEDDESLQETMVNWGIRSFRNKEV